MCRGRFTGLDVARIVRYDIGVQCPVLVDLGREFHEVPRHRGARLRDETHIGEQSVQRMAELVEQRHQQVETQQRRLPVGRVRDVHDVDDDGLGALLAGPLDERRHPRPATLGGARV